MTKNNNAKSVPTDNGLSAHSNRAFSHAYSSSDEDSMNATNGIMYVLERLFRSDNTMIAIEYPLKSAMRWYGYDQGVRVVLYSRGDVE